MLRLLIRKDCHILWQQMNRYYLMVVKVYNLKSEDDELQKANLNFKIGEERAYEEILGKKNFQKVLVDLMKHH